MMFYRVQLLSLSLSFALSLSVCVCFALPLFLTVRVRVMGMMNIWDEGHFPLLADVKTSDFHNFHFY